MPKTGCLCKKREERAKKKLYNFFCRKPPPFISAKRKEHSNFFFFAVAPKSPGGFSSTLAYTTSHKKTFKRLFLIFLKIQNVLDNERQISWSSLFFIWDMLYEETDPSSSSFHLSKISVHKFSSVGASDAQFAVFIARVCRVPISNEEEGRKRWSAPFKLLFCMGNYHLILHIRSPSLSQDGDGTGEEGRWDPQKR